jgi:hypothetical protein
VSTTLTHPPSHLTDCCRFLSDGSVVGHDDAPAEDYGICYTRLRLTRCRACDAFTLRSIGTGAEVLDDLLADAYPIESTGPLWPSIEAPGAKPIVLAPKKRGVRRRHAPKTPCAIRAERIREYLRRKHGPATVRELHLVLGIPESALYSRHLRNVASGRYGIRVHREAGRLQWEAA